MQQLMDAYQHLENLMKISDKIEAEPSFAPFIYSKKGVKLKKSAAAQMFCVVAFFLSHMKDIGDRQLAFVNNLGDGKSEMKMDFLLKNVEEYRNRSEFPYDKYFGSVARWGKSTGAADIIQSVITETDGIITCLILDNPECADKLKQVKNDYMAFLEENLKQGSDSTTARGKAETSAHAPVDNVPLPPSNTQPIMKPQGGKIFMGIILPLFLGLGFGILFFLTFFIPLIILAVAAFVWFFTGLGKYNSRCEKCGTWSAFFVAESVQVGKEKVKVARTLTTNSTRLSIKGRTGYTHSRRNVLVSADEITYKELYQCKNCGYQKAGTRKVIDDKIRR